MLYTELEKIHLKFNAGFKKLKAVFKHFLNHLIWRFELFLKKKLRVFWIKHEKRSHEVRGTANKVKKHLCCSKLTKTDLSDNTCDDLDSQSSET